MTLKPTFPRNQDISLTVGSLLRPIGIITRDEVKANLGYAVYVFGDNMERRGFGGQAAAMRGETNAIGVPTKWRPSRQKADYFCNADWERPDVRNAILDAFQLMRVSMLRGLNVAIPIDGLGTERARLPELAPKIYEEIERLIGELEKW